MVDVVIERLRNRIVLPAPHTFRVEEDEVAGVKMSIIFAMIA